MVIGLYRSYDVGLRVL